MKIAVFAGSFDPFTVAHLDLVQRGLHLFDKIVIAIGINSAKQGMMDYADREAAISALFSENPRVEVQQFTGLTVHFCQQVGASYILRGLRNTQDFEFENAIAQNNLSLAPSIETYFLMAKSGLAHVSSTIVRDIYRNDGDIVALVPQEIVRYLK
ncbi:pantetheine-phosphate adenylyltransferase [Sphingobacterium bambusae]|uniref:Phosphopantetheine adenylyltransferase n=1 Tax=Sphingobacterium bambusae TaxID=662858 RepID=A0ABW6BF26_9SPHI|nr:pantetheine-phosphate adenylyltransferase [Sphingobacterium bambusae]WPL48715.1 pantetheine-phosphate adenylyltransferase [Sphingobacterium bambusae]